jgi:hypothetical protein
LLLLSWPWILNTTKFIWRKAGKGSTFAGYCAALAVEASHRRESATPRPGRGTSRRCRAEQPFGGGAGFGGNLGAGQHAGDFLAAVIGRERIDAGGDALALVERIL